MAYQQIIAANNDKLQVFVSTDCGGSWRSIWARAGAALQPASVMGQSNISFVATPAQYTTYTVNLGTVASSTNAMFRWVFYAGSSLGNNIYLDNINVNNTMNGIQSTEIVPDFILYPNPSTADYSLQFVLSESEKLGIVVTDLLGRVIEEIPNATYPAGESVINLGKKQYQPGVYLVNLAMEGKRIFKKVVIQ